MPTDLPISKNGRSSASSMISIGIMIVLAIFALVMRLAPLPSNFACIGALSLVSGYVLRGPVRWFLPMVTMFASDCLGHFLEIPGISFYSFGSMAINYVGFLSMVAVGALAHRLFGDKFNWTTTSAVCISGLLGSLAFFLISNFGSWLDPMNAYELSWNGLMQCYYMGIPFWRPTLISDFLFSVSFYAFYQGAFVLLTKPEVARING